LVHHGVDLVIAEYKKKRNAISGKEVSGCTDHDRRSGPR
jgi:hypothetical protein